MIVLMNSQYSNLQLEEMWQLNILSNNWQMCQFVTANKSLKKFNFNRKKSEKFWISGNVKLYCRI